MTVNAKFNGKKIQFTGLATEHVDELLLGLTWLQEQNANLKFGSGELLIGERKYLDGEKSLLSCRRVSFMQDVVVPSRSQLHVMANVINN